MASQYSNGHRIVECCHFLRTRRTRDGLPQEGMVALEVFAGDGMSEMRHLAPHFALVRGWEIDPTKMDRFYKEVPYAGWSQVYQYELGDAFEKIRDPSLPKVQHVFIDHVIGIYGDKNQYCEYFEMLPLAIPVVDPRGGCITINVTEQPYGYYWNSEWARRRYQYYQPHKPSDLDPADMAGFHEKIINLAGYVMEDYQVVPRLRKAWGDKMTYTYWTFYIKEERYTR